MVCCDVNGGDMSKIIIHTKDISDIDALNYVLAVISEGMISETGNGKQYCFVTAWENTMVYASRSKSGTHTFKVWGKS
jgi:hypothetical protein